VSEAVQGKAVAVRGVQQVFGVAPNQHRAIERLDLQINAGEFVTIVGPSGCGKTSLLRIVGGLDRPSSGVVEIDGTVVTRPSPDHGIVFQKPNLFPWLNVIDNVLFGPRMRGGRRGKSEAREAALHYLAAVGLSGTQHRKVYELSGGMMHRVALARVLISQPGLLLMDEPFAALDAQTRLTMQQLVASIWLNDRPSVLFITHDVEEALILSDRVIVMSAAPGRLKYELDVDLPRPRYTAVITSPQFTAYKATLLEQIRAEVAIEPMGGAA
jgi:NitT/TauT family transport system ATP-binding protein